MSSHDRERWDEKYGERNIPNAVIVDEWLMRHITTMKPGRAVDLACGLGHNAIWLAQLGWQVDAVDISSVGLSLAKQFAARESASVNFICADLETSLFDEFSQFEVAYDLVVVFRYLDREHLPALIPRLLNPGGHLIYETFNRRQLERADSHIRDERYTLSPGELPLLYSKLQLVEYEEADLPDRSVARLLARA